MNTVQLFKNPEQVSALRERIPENYSFKALSNAFVSSVKKQCGEEKECAVLFSGGLDSSLIAFTVKKFVNQVELFCVGLKNSNSLTRARDSAELLGLNLNEVILEKGELTNLLPKTRKVIDSSSFLQLSIALPVFAALCSIKQNCINRVFSGTGADELFCGYSEFKTVLEKEGFLGVEELIWKKLAGMFERNLKRELALVNHFNLALCLPFLEKKFVLEAMAFPPEKKIFSPSDELRKRALRELAQKSGLPERMCFEKKKAIQYDSGIVRELKKIV